MGLYGLKEASRRSYKSLMQSCIISPFPGTPSAMIYVPVALACGQTSRSSETSSLRSPRGSTDRCCAWLHAREHLQFKPTTSRGRSAALGSSSTACGPFDSSQRAQSWSVRPTGRDPAHHGGRLRIPHAGLRRVELVRCVGGQHHPWRDSVRPRMASVPWRTS